eukprot:1160412-Pelagomonas_calceolata.AAC.15
MLLIITGMPIQPETLTLHIPPKPYPNAVPGLPKHILNSMAWFRLSVQTLKVEQATRMAIFLLPATLVMSKMCAG